MIPVSNTVEPTEVSPIRQPLDVAGASGGSLADVRFVVKDVIDVAGLPTRSGSPAWTAAHPAPAAAHAPVVAALLDAGAHLVGKAVCDELAFSVNGTNPHDGMPANPAAPGRVPGGSSSGSAAAVAAGDAEVGIGTDTGGSVRVPASYCGLYGVRPTHGRTDLRGIVPLAPTFDTVGWFARDAAMMAAVGRVLLAPRAESPGQLRLVPCLEAFDVARPDVAHAVLTGLRGRFVDRVVEPRRLELRLSEWAATRYTIQSFETWQAHGGWIQGRLDQLGSGVRTRMEEAARTTARQYAAALTRRTQLVRSLADVLAPDEVACFPTTPTPAPTVAESRDREVDRRTDVFVLGALAGLWGAPELSIPGVTVDGLPVGMSLVGAPGTDHDLLRLAEETAGRRHPRDHRPERSDPEASQRRHR